MWWYHQLLSKLLFCDILRTIRHTDLKYGCTNFYKQSKQLAKCQHLGIGLLSFDLSFFFPFVFVPTLVKQFC